MDYHFRPAKSSEASQIWQILKDAIQRRKEDGSNQWQDGYPNIDVVKKDIERKIGFVFTQNESIIGYTAVIILCTTITPAGGAPGQVPPVHRPAHDMPAVGAPRIT